MKQRCIGVSTQREEFKLINLLNHLAILTEIIYNGEADQIFIMKEIVFEAVEQTEIYIFSKSNV